MDTYEELYASLIMKLVFLSILACILFKAPHPKVLIMHVSMWKEENRKQNQRKIIKNKIKIQRVLQ